MPAKRTRKPTSAKAKPTLGDTNLALIYGRVSSKKQVIAGDGLNSQLTACLNYAASRGYEVCGTYTDDLTGSASRRPGLDALLETMKSDPSKRYRVVFDHINRFSRDMYLYGDLRRMIDDMGGILESPTMIFGNDSTSRLVENMSVAVSDYQRKHNMEQTNVRMRARLENGYAVFAASAGFRFEKVRGHSGKLLVRQEPVASVVVEALEGFASGHFGNAADVHRFLEAHPLFPKSRKGKVPHQRVGDMLRNPIYAGLVGSESWGISFRKGHHEALISIATFQSIQDRLNGVVRLPSRKNLSEDFVLRSHVMCDDCGEPLTACWSKGSHARHPYYLCHRRACAAYGKSIRRDVIEGEFERLLQTVEPDPRVFAMATAMFKELWARRAANGAARVKALKDELARVERQIEDTVERIVEMSVPAALNALEAEIGRLESEKLLIAEKMASAALPQGTYEQRLRTALDFLASPWQLWNSGCLEARQAVLKLTFADRLRYKRGEGFRTANLSLPFKVLASFLSGEKVMAHPTRFERVTFAFGGTLKRASSEGSQPSCSTISFMTSELQGQPTSTKTTDQ